MFHVLLLFLYCVPVAILVLFLYYTAIVKVRRLEIWKIRHNLFNNKAIVMLTA